MRDELKVLMGRFRDDKGPEHAGLAHERYAPVKEDTEGSPWSQWLSWMEHSRQPEGYDVAYNRWKESLRQWNTVSMTLRAESRLLVGHGNASPTGVGLTLHHTWGVPVIPGSSLKGVLASYLRATFENGEVEKECRLLFGAPGDEATETEASVGRVIFHDAPWSHPQGEGGTNLMLARDVLTVHQSTWYNGRGWPNDYDSPTPVSFLSIKPGGCFRVALSVAPNASDEDLALLRWAADRLREVLSTWGVGGKTAAGYGRLSMEGAVEFIAAKPVSRPSPLRDSFLAWLAEHQAKKTKQRDLLDAFETDWLEKLSILPATTRQACAQDLEDSVNSPKLEARRDELRRRLSPDSGGTHGSH